MVCDCYSDALDVFVHFMVVLDTPDNNPIVGKIILSIDSLLLKCFIEDTCSKAITVSACISTCTLIRNWLE